MPAGPPVVLTHESSAGDTTMGEHRDEWYGVIVQIDGAKRWLLRTDRAAEPEEIVVSAGDVLLLPRQVWHAVSTPQHSLHAVFAILTHEPITRSAN